MFKDFMLSAAFIAVSMSALNTTVYADKLYPIIKQENKLITFEVTQNLTVQKFQKLNAKQFQTFDKNKLVPGLSFKFAGDMKSKLESMQWTMVAGSKGRPILSGNQYRLTNSISGRGLKRQKRTIAANLGWLSSNSKDFTVRIKRKSGDGQIRYGDIVALELKSYGWLRFKKQRKGINISDDNNTPHYDWTVQGGIKGTKLVSDMPFALYFDKYRTQLVYCKRAWGIDLGWYRRSKCDGWKASLSNRVFGENGLYSRDGLTGKAFVKLRDHLCETAVTATGAAIIAYTGASAVPVVTAGAPYAINECKKL